ncbi:MAG: response regulator [Herminiimonas sp.]|nr:response regulator [Herminiimonas sp.]
MDELNGHSPGNTLTPLDYAALFAASPYPYLLLDTGLVIIGANRAYLQMTGRAGDIVGQHLFDAFPPNPDDPDSTNIDYVRNSLLKAIATKVADSTPFLRYAVRRETPDGTIFDDRYWSAVHTPILDSAGNVLMVAQNASDVTDTHRAQLAQRDTERRLQEGMIAARMVIWDLDLVNGQVRFSANANVVFGGDWTGVGSVWEAIHPDDMAGLHAARNKAITERGDYRQTVRLIRPDTAAILWLDVRGKIVCNADGIPIAVRGVSVDITERTRAEEELREADRRKDEFLAMLAHELRNPLAPISAAAQLLRMPSVNTDVIRKTSDVISRQVAHMTRLIDDLLDVSRVTRGLIELERAPLAVQDIIADAVEQVRPAVAARRHDLIIDLPAIAIELIGDQKRLVQVLTNLLNNAAKYTSEAGRIRLGVSVVAGDVVICVEDNGIGIAPELLPHVFDLFTQAERTPDRSQGGLGLGLSLVSSLVALHGGTVMATSGGRGMGSVFTVRLPSTVVPAQPVPETLPAAPQAPRATGLRLLVVDDNADAAEMLGAFMESAGHTVRVEYDPLRAIEWAKVDPPDVCLLDIGLPGMDGNELARTLRTLPQLAQTMLIAVTGYGKEFDRDQSIAAGFDYYFVKPADPAALVTLLTGFRRH